MILATHPTLERVRDQIVLPAHGADDERGGGLMVLVRRHGRCRGDAVKQDEARVASAAEAGALPRRNS